MDTQHKDLMGAFEVFNNAQHTVQLLKNIAQWLRSGCRHKRPKSNFFAHMWLRSIFLWQYEQHISHGTQTFSIRIWATFICDPKPTGQIFSQLDLSLNHHIKIHVTFMPEPDLNWPSCRMALAERCWQM